MIAAVCLNPCIDRTVEIDAFVYGGMNRIRALRNDGSGKGVNVALAAHELGLEAACIGILPNENAAPVLSRLEDAGCRADFVRVPGGVRVNTKVINREDHVVTEINESGELVSADTMQAVIELVRAWSAKADILIMTGSLPPGCPADFYKTLMEACACRCILDAEGEKLTLGLAAHPFLIKPNQFELEAALGRALPEPADVLRGVREMNGDGMAVVSMGADGAVFSFEGAGWYAPRIPIEALSTVGAGDCMVAGMLYALERGMEPVEVFRHGVAGGTAGCMTPGTMLLRKEDFTQQLERVQLIKI